MKTVIAIRHVAFEDLGSWEPLLSQSHQIKYFNPAEQNPANLQHENIDLLVVLGGPIGVYQDEEYPFLKNEIKLLEQRLKKDLPTLGICLGSQLIARALGSRVYPNAAKEIGWLPLKLTDEGKKHCIEPLSPELTSMFHWHGDTFDLPKEATLLASTSSCQNQIFSWGKNTLAFQCHPEVTAHRLESWWIGHAAELSQNNLSAKTLRKQSQEFSAKLESQSKKCLQNWLTKEI